MRWCVIAILTFTAGCGTSELPPVSVSASNAEAQQLAGRWSGSYVGISTGRHGSIVFALQASNGSARGDVVMIADDRSKPTGTDERARVAMPIVQPLKIQFVVISGRQVTGMLEPYEDPACHCLLSTTFVGQLDGDLIKGDFVTWGGSNAAPQRGTWSVRRSRTND
jgi:hypothetical protein